MVQSQPFWLQLATSNCRGCDGAAAWILSPSGNIAALLNAFREQLLQCDHCKAISASIIHMGRENRSVKQSPLFIQKAALETCKYQFFGEGTYSQINTFAGATAQCVAESFPPLWGWAPKIPRVTGAGKVTVLYLCDILCTETILPLERPWLWVVQHALSTSRYIMYEM